MITIYCTTSVYFKNRELLNKAARLTEEELFELVKEDTNGIWFVSPHNDSVLYRKFINGRLTKDGYVAEGFYWTKLCGEKVDFRLIEDANCIKARENNYDWSY